MRDHIRRLNHMMSETEAVYHELSLKLGISDSEMRVLYTVCMEGGACLLADIIRLNGCSKQTVNSALRKLEKSGIVALCAADGRKKQVCLTEEGKESVKHTALRMIRLEEEIFAEWTPEECEQYLHFTARYLDAMKRKTREL